MSPPGRPGFRQAAAATAGEQLPGGPAAPAAAAAAAPGQLVLRRRSLPARLLGLLGRREAQEAAGAPGPGALKPGNSAQDLPKPSCPSAQGHPGHPPLLPSTEARGRGSPARGRRPRHGVLRRAGPPAKLARRHGEGSPAARAGRGGEVEVAAVPSFFRRSGGAGGGRAAAARPSAEEERGEGRRAPGLRPSGTRPAPALACLRERWPGGSGRAGRSIPSAAVRGGRRGAGQLLPLLLLLLQVAAAWAAERRPARRGRRRRCQAAGAGPGAASPGAPGRSAAPAGGGGAGPAAWPWRRGAGAPRAGGAARSRPGRRAGRRRPRTEHLPRAAAGRRRALAPAASCREERRIAGGFPGERVRAARPQADTKTEARRKIEK